MMLFTDPDWSMEDAFAPAAASAIPSKHSEEFKSSLPKSASKTIHLGFQEGEHEKAADGVFESKAVLSSKEVPGFETTVLTEQMVHIKGKHTVVEPMDIREPGVRWEEKPHIAHFIVTQGTSSAKGKSNKVLYSQPG